MRILTILLYALIVGAVILTTVAVAQTINGESPPANPLYVALLALTPIMIAIIGWLVKREISRIETGHADLLKKQEKDKEDAERERRADREQADRDREEIYRNMRADREQMTTAVSKVGEALISVDKRLVAIEAVARMSSTPSPIPKL